MLLLLHKVHNKLSQATHKVELKDFQVKITGTHTDSHNNPATANGDTSNSTATTSNRNTATVKGSGSGSP